MISCIDNQPTGPSVPHRTDLQAEFFTPAREPEIKQRWGPPRDACRIGSPVISRDTRYSGGEAFGPQADLRVTAPRVPPLRDAIDNSRLR